MRQYTGGKRLTIYFANISKIRVGTPVPFTIS